jgi:hypothetical protein
MVYASHLTLFFPLSYFYGRWALLVRVFTFPRPKIRTHVAHRPCTPTGQPRGASAEPRPRPGAEQPRDPDVCAQEPQADQAPAAPSSLDSRAPGCDPRRAAIPHQATCTARSTASTAAPQAANPAPVPQPHLEPPGTCRALLSQPDAPRQERTRDRSPRFLFPVPLQPSASPVPSPSLSSLPAINCRGRPFPSSPHLNPVVSSSHVCAYGT